MIAVLSPQENWLSSAIGEERDPKAIASVLAKTPELLSILTESVQTAEESVRWCNEQGIPSFFGHYVAMLMISQFRKLYPDLQFMPDGQITERRAS